MEAMTRYARVWLPWVAGLLWAALAAAVILTIAYEAAFPSQRNNILTQFWRMYPAMTIVGAVVGIVVLFTKLFGARFVFPAIGLLLVSAMIGLGQFKGAFEAFQAIGFVAAIVLPLLAGLLMIVVPFGWGAGWMARSVIVRSGTRRRSLAATGVVLATAFSFAPPALYGASLSLHDTLNDHRCRYAAWNPLWKQAATAILSLDRAEWPRVQVLVEEVAEARGLHLEGDDPWVWKRHGSWPILNLCLRGQFAASIYKYYRAPDDFTVTLSFYAPASSEVWRATADDLLKAILTQWPAAKATFHGELRPL